MKITSTTTSPTTSTFGTSTSTTKMTMTSSQYPNINIALPRGKKGQLLLSFASLISAGHGTLSKLAKFFPNFGVLIISMHFYMAKRPTVKGRNN